MTNIGKKFALIADTTVRKWGFGSKKMTCGYVVYEDDGFEVSETYREEAEMLDQLVKMGYLTKFTTQAYFNNKERNWRYRFVVKNVCFGLTEKGWEVAPKYLAALEREDKIGIAELKAKNYCEKCKNTDNPITYEEAFALAMQGTL